MVDTINIDIKRVEKSRINEIDFDNIDFAKIYSDHMFVCDFEDGKWQTPAIIPYGMMEISPATPAIHYGHGVFEGMKAYKNDNGNVSLFRPYDNFNRLNISGHRLCFPELPEEIFMEGLKTLLDLDKDWVPSKPGTSLYVRPFIFSTEEFIGIRPSQRFKFMIITSPVGSYYSFPVKVKVETKYTRAAPGGTGYAKAAGNYAGSIYPAKLAQDKGYHQLIWTDSKEHKYIEESGTMNVMFILNDTLITPPAGDTILKGITRDSVLTIARDWGMKVEERPITVEEIIQGAKEGSLSEAFGVGTAATVSSIELIGHEDKDYQLPSEMKFAAKIGEELEAIKTGKKEDRFGWNHFI